MIENLFNSGAIPVLERTVQFTAKRHQHITPNIANLSTPGYKPTDLDPDAFQQALGKAIDRRRQSNGGPVGDLNMPDTEQLRFHDNGIEVRARRTRDNILFHDRNDRSLEHQMKDLADNAGVHTTALRILKSEFDILESAIRERA